MGNALVKYNPEMARPPDPTVGPFRRTGEHRGREAFLDDPEMVDLFARALSDGWTTAQLASSFNVSDRSVRTYKKDPRVKAASLKYTQDRILTITRKTDAEIERRLQSAGEIELVDLIRLRKEFLGGVFRTGAEGGKTDDRTITEAMDELEGNPDLAAELLKLLGGRAPKPEAV